MPINLSVNDHPHVFFTLWYVFIFLQYAWSRVQRALENRDSSAESASPLEPESEVEPEPAPETTAPEEIESTTAA